MEFDEFLKLMRKRRSIRKFKPDPVPEGYIEKILEASRPCRRLGTEKHSDVATRASS